MSGESMPDWRQLSRQVGLSVSGSAIDIRVGSDRHHLVHVDEQRHVGIRLWSIVARPSALRGLRTPRIDAWYRNRLSEFVGFDLDRRGRMIGEAWIPPGPITPQEWDYYVGNLARACDRYEFLLTGRDEV